MTQGRPTPSRRLHELRAGQVETLVRSDSLLIQPIAAVEQHGPHLPFGTDLIIAKAFSDAVVERFGDDLDCYVLPEIAYGKSNEHDWCPGTISLRATTLLAALEDVGTALGRLRSKKLVFLNGHGGNSALLQVACREVRLRSAMETFMVHPTLPPDAGGSGEAVEEGMGIHAGLQETSMLLHLRPDLVDMSVAHEHIPRAIAANRHVRFGGSVSFGWSSADFGPSGVIGDPTGATAELGAAHFEQTLPLLAEQLAEIRAFRFS